MGQVIDVDQLEQLRADLVTRGARTVFTNGHFDLLHVGHVRYLQRARELGDVLIVAVNDDATTTARKGPTRPIVPESERAELVAALECVDFAFVFHDDTARRPITTLKPDVYVKGGDYAARPGDQGSPLPEASAVRAYGGTVEIIPTVEGQSTTGLERRIVDRWRAHGQDAP